MLYTVLLVRMHVLCPNIKLIFCYLKLQFLCNFYSVQTKLFSLVTLSFLALTIPFGRRWSETGRSTPKINCTSSDFFFHLYSHWGKERIPFIPCWWWEITLVATVATRADWHICTNGPSEHHSRRCLIKFLAQGHNCSVVNSSVVANKHLKTLFWRWSNSLRVKF